MKYAFTKLIVGAPFFYGQVFFCIASPSDGVDDKHTNSPSEQNMQHPDQVIQQVSGNRYCSRHFSRYVVIMCYYVLSKYFCFQIHRSKTIPRTESRVRVFRREI